MNKLKFNHLKKNCEKNNLLTVQIFFNLQNHPIFHAEEKVEQLSKRALLVYLCFGRILPYDHVKCTPPPPAKYTYIHSWAQPPLIR